MSVDTYLKGKDLEPYRRGDTGEDLNVLVAPELFKIATSMRIHAAGALFKKLKVVLDDKRGGVCMP